MHSSHPSLTAAKSEPSVFEQETITLLDQFRGALTQVVEASIGTVRKSRDIQERFGVNFILSWQIYRILHSDNPLSLSPHVPSAGMMKRLLAAAALHQGVTPGMLASVERAHAEFERHVARYADDRTTFDTMIATLVGGETEEQVEATHRRALFDAQRYFCGVHLDTFFTCMIVGSGDLQQRRVDCVHVRSKCGLRRTNPHSAFIIDQRKIARDAVEARGTVTPLDQQAAEQYGTSILPAFCSTSSLPLRQTETADGTTTTEWIAESIGLPSTVDIAFGEIFRNVIMERRPDGRWGLSGTALFTTPARRSIHDFLVHRPTFGRVAHEVTRWGPVLDFPTRVPSDSGLPRLHGSEILSYVGSGAAAAHAVEMPDYVNMLKFSCKQMGWSLENLDVYRMRVDYPLLYTLLSIELTFPGSEAWTANQK